MTWAPITGPIQSALVVLECNELDGTLDFFADKLGFQLEVISPADDPSMAVLAGYGLRIRLQVVAGSCAPSHLELMSPDPGELFNGELNLIAPNGTRINLIESNPEVNIPPLAQSLVVSTISGNAKWGFGRAGMEYRDLEPGRQGGRFIASHIRIPDGGPVPDYVHFHKVRFQLIFCYRGWVKVVYEDQGEPFVLQAGDCVLQPPEIRHRVLESSSGLEVIEISCPAEHDTLVERLITLPTAQVKPDRIFGGQLFVRHEAALATWLPWRYEGFEFRDLGIAEATFGLAGARVIRPTTATQTPVVLVENEFFFTFVMDGSVTLVIPGQVDRVLEAGDSFVMPADQKHALTDIARDTQFLEVSLPGELRAIST
ncbi:MAG: cupin [Actinobacteria bacterium]|nr:MAG: cupin [Actinomycetota bacterium]